jgi:hypothetical protein
MRPYLGCVQRPLRVTRLAGQGKVSRATKPGARRTAAMIADQRLASIAAHRRCAGVGTTARKPMRARPCLAGVADVV